MWRLYDRSKSVWNFLSIVSDERGRRRGKKGRKDTDGRGSLVPPSSVIGKAPLVSVSVSVPISVSVRAISCGGEGGDPRWRRPTCYETKMKEMREFKGGDARRKHLGWVLGACEFARNRPCCSC